MFAHYDADNTGGDAQILPPCHKHAMNTLKPSPHIAVIGAGMAGLSCAMAQREAECPPVGLFDKSREPAGRMSTDRDGDWECDHGAKNVFRRRPGIPYGG